MRRAVETMRTTAHELLITCTQYVNNAATIHNTSRVRRLYPLLSRSRVHTQARMVSTPSVSVSVHFSPLYTPLITTINLYKVGDK